MRADNKKVPLIIYYKIKMITNSYAYKKLHPNIESTIEHTNYKYYPTLSSQTEKIFHNGKN